MRSSRRASTACPRPSAGWPSTRPWPARRSGPAQPHAWTTGPSAPDDLLGSLERRTIVHEHEHSAVAGDREWEFKHMVIRDVAYGRLPKGRRVGLHVRFADWITELPDGGEEFVEILAYHLEQSCLLAREVGRTDVPPPIDRAVEALRRAGEKAELREGLREAHRFYTRALAIVEEGDGAVPAGDRAASGPHGRGARRAARRPTTSSRRCSATLGHWLARTSRARR